MGRLLRPSHERTGNQQRPRRARPYPNFAMADWMRNQNEEGVDPPMPPMAVDPAIRIPELKNVLKQYGVDGYFPTFPA